jgi:hypothetical protein
LKQFEKRPVEVRDVGVEFDTIPLDEDETLSSAVVSAKDSAGADATATVFGSSAGIVGTKVTARIKAGQAIGTYSTTWTTTTSKGRVYSEVVPLLVEA